MSTARGDRVTDLGAPDVIAIIDQLTATFGPEVDRLVNNLRRTRHEAGDSVACAALMRALLYLMPHGETAGIAAIALMRLSEHTSPPSV
jgi:hypothetical protein